MNLTAVPIGTRERVEGWKRPRKGEAEVIGLPANVREAMLALPDGIYDGEFVAMIPGAKSGDAARVSLPKQFIVFDVLELVGTSLIGYTVEDRRAALELAVAHSPSNAVVAVPQVAASWQAVEAIWAAGGEGAILKRRGSCYRPGKRAAEWIKVKKLEQHRVRITGFVAGKFGPYTNVAFVFPDGMPGECLTKDGGWREEIAANPDSFIGRDMIIECHERYEGGKGRAREPRAKRILADHMAAEGE